MRLIDADPIIKNLSEMKTQLGYDAIAIDGMIKSLREAKEITSSEQPNDPLTLEELREIDGEPVWVQYGQYDGEWLIVAWNIYDAISYARKAPFKLSVYSYGDTWIAYRRKPEEGTA